MADLPRLMQPVAVAGRGVARTHAPVFRDGAGGLGDKRHHGPVLECRGQGPQLRSDRRTSPALHRPGIPRQRRRRRRRLNRRHPRQARARPGRALPSAQRRAASMPGRSSTTMSCRAAELPAGAPVAKARLLLAETVANTAWRQRECINLIPSEMTASPMVRLASVTDPAFRYAEHRGLKAFYDDEIFYYQGTDFIAAGGVAAGGRARAKYLGCAETETRLDQRADGQHGGLQRDGRLHQPRRPQGRAAPHRAW